MPYISCLGKVCLYYFLIFHQTSKMIPENLRIIIADDDVDDQSLLTDALIANGIGREMIVLVSNGEELSGIVHGYSKFPSIIFLDLNMPKKNGLKVLAEIKGDPNLKHMPVLIFTTSTSPVDIASCYELGANTYFTKPFSYSDLISLVQTIKTYWFEMGVLPRSIFSR